MITLHEILYYMDTETPVKVVIHSPVKECGSEFHTHNDTVYVGKAGAIL